MFKAWKWDKIIKGGNKQDQKEKGKKGKRINVWVLGHRDAKIPGTLEILAAEAA